MKKQPEYNIIFKEVLPDLGNRAGSIKKQYRKKKDEVFPIRIFHDKLPIGLILFKPHIQIQIKGKKLEATPKSLGEAKATVLNLIHQYL